MRMNLFPRLMFAVFLFVLIFISIVVVSYFVNTKTLEEWLQTPQAPGRLMKLSKNSLFVRDQGKGSPTVVILTGLSVASVEWWKVQELVSKITRTITYDRPGYTWSAPTQPLSAYEQSELLAELLRHLKVSELKPCQKTSNEAEIVLIVQNMASEIAKAFLQTYPDEVKSVIFVDPLIKPYQPDSHIPQKWQTNLIDQSRSLKRAQMVADIGFFRFLNLTPYDVPEDIRPHVLNNLANPVTAETARKEYEDLILQPSLQPEHNMPQCSNAGAYSRHLVVHSKAKNLELLQSMDVPNDVAEIIETEWRQSAIKTANVDPKDVIETSNTLFAPHIEEPQLLLNLIRNTVEKKSAR